MSPKKKKRVDTPETPRNTPYAAETKVWAHELYLKGHGTFLIARKVSEATGRKCFQSTIERWRKSGKWDVDRKAVQTTVKTDMVRYVSEELLNRQKEQLGGYQTLADKGLTALKSDKIVIKKMSDVVDMIDKGIQGERRIAAGLVSLDLIEALARIVVEEVQEDEVKRKIAARFTALAMDVLKL